MIGVAQEYELADTEHSSRNEGVAGMANQEVGGFMENLMSFYESLPEDQKPMLEAILETARDGADTSGYMMTNPYTAEMLARGQQDDRLREAEHTRMVRLAEAGSEGSTQRRGGASLFGWLSGWLTAVRAHGAPQERGGAISETP